MSSTYPGRRRMAPDPDKQSHTRARPTPRRTTNGGRSTAPRKAFVQAARLAAALQALAHGLPNPWDESSDAFHSFVAELAATTKLSAEALRTALKIGPRYHIDLSPAGPALTELAGADRRLGKDVAAGFAQLA